MRVMIEIERKCKMTKIIRLKKNSVGEWCYYKDPITALTMGAARAAKASPMPLPVRHLPLRRLPVFLLVVDRLIFPAPNVLRPLPLG